MAVRNQTAHYTLNDTYNADSVVVNYYLPYKHELEKEMNRVLGYTDVDLTKPSQPETLLGNFFADALLNEGRKLHPEIDFAIGTKGGLRAELVKGEITLGDLFEVMPFDNKLVILTLTGNNVLELLKFISVKDGQPVAGISMKINGTDVKDIIISGQSFDTAKTYIVLTYDFLANGGDNITGLSKPVNRIDIEKGVRDALIEYVSNNAKKNKHINTQLDGRIIYEQ